eukprot:TRINITY_DN5729_c0_g1_i2.p1 TRINITY_DN5729_c0_g1~~TRINITY_DN5729_c0_g1_i2.p1  ORF type:complete len:388 (-),score=112.96 TRINITY_DN5729_c0_g1_i2:795-1883(-)
MSTPTVIRVKRRITEDPSDILVLSAKRIRTESGSNYSAETDKTQAGKGQDIRLLKLAGTVEQSSGQQDIAKIIHKKKLPNFEELKKQYKKSSTKSSTKTRAKAKNIEREEERFRVVSSNRSIQETEDDSEKKDTDEKDPEQNPMYQLYDVFEEKDKEKTTKEKAPERLSCNGVEMIREYRGKPISDDYVYDLYFAEQDEFGDFNDSLFDGLVSIQPFCFGDTEFMYDEYRDDPKEFQYGDDEDSNDEDYRGNEYPDEDEFSDDDDLDYGDYRDSTLDLGIDRLRVTAADGEEGEELSSDEEDQLLYTQSFDQDVALHGKGYAKYKAKMLKEFQEDGLFSDSDDEEGSDDNDNDDITANHLYF